MKSVRLALLFLVSLPGVVLGQDRPSLNVQHADLSTASVPVDLERGYAAVQASVLTDLGWLVSESGGAVEIAAADEISISMRLGSPFFRWDGVVLQLTDPPYRSGTQTFVPLQFLTDFLPRRLPGLYDFDGPRSLLRVGELELLGDLPDEVVAAVPEDVAERPSPATEDILPTESFTDDSVRVVIIDAGHGGGDPGALGPDGIREKDVALAIAMRLAAHLEDASRLEVRLVRDDDSFVDLWERGQIATELKRDRPGIFVSIHANSFPARREASGFETYFLSDARTEHERRVSAIENAPLSMAGQNVDSEELPDIDFILRDLRNYDHAHWSEELATLVQEELSGFHPGPNRGVKQGVLAVLTNALMPSVLIEVGYLSNEAEGRLLGGEGFHRDAASAIADGVVRFFERYPPRSGGRGSKEDR